MRNFVKGFKPALKNMDWFDWFWLSFVVFVGWLFRGVMIELMNEFRP